MRGRLLKAFMVVLVLIPVGLTAYLANNLYHRKGVPEALENLTRQLFKSKEEERRAETRAVELERKTTELQTAYDALVADLRGEVDSREIRVRQFREKLEINFVDKVLFASGSSDITPKGRDILLKVAAVLARVKDKSIYVVGHTDNVPIHSGLYPSNWELSTARSSSVIRYLSETGGLTPERFTAMGRAFYQPVASNATSEGRQENRRVDIIVADVPLLAGETGSEAARSSAPESGKTPDGTAAPVVPSSEGEPLRESAPPPALDAPPAQPAGPAGEVRSSGQETAAPVAPPALEPAQTGPAAGEPGPATGAAAGSGAEALEPRVANPFQEQGAQGQPEGGAGQGEKPAQGPAASPDLPPPLPDKSRTGAM